VIQPVAVDDGVSRRFEELDVLQTDLPHLLGGPLRSAADVALMLRQRADARDGEILFQLLNVAIPLHVDEIDDLADVVHICLRRVPMTRPTYGVVGCSMGRSVRS